MSSQRGNVHRRGPPKHANKSKFKNDLHDNTKKIKMINGLSVTGCCGRCKEIIDWKIKYKKYKPLSQPRKCVRCGNKTVRRAYYIMCDACATENKVCAKCGEEREIVLQPSLSAAAEFAQQNQLEQELKLLPERKRRTFLRAQASCHLQEAVEAAEAHDSDSGDDNTTDEDQSEQQETEVGERHDGQDVLQGARKSRSLQAGRRHVETCMRSVSESQRQICDNGDLKDPELDGVAGLTLNDTLR